MMTEREKEFHGEGFSAGLIVGIISALATVAVLYGIHQVHLYLCN